MREQRLEEPGDRVIAQIGRDDADANRAVGVTDIAVGDMPVRRDVELPTEAVDVRRRGSAASVASSWLSAKNSPV